MDKEATKVKEVFQTEHKDSRKENSKNPSEIKPTQTIETSRIMKPIKALEPNSSVEPCAQFAANNFVAANFFELNTPLESNGLMEPDKPIEQGNSVLLFNVESDSYVHPSCNVDQEQTSSNTLEPALISQVIYFKYLLGKYSLFYHQLMDVK